MMSGAGLGAIASSRPTISPPNPLHSRRSQVQMERTKRSKNKKLQQKRSPIKLNSRKPLQIWSPVKERKPKSKGRMATLTLQEINAWTEASKRPVVGGREKNPAGQTDQVVVDDSPIDGAPV
ncbi:unnamed protein product [Linum trigynum]|uniref:Uncharacterized protein n=1 Tax=Linum trigynum TaxID=586398 RepID=A0AAV2GAH7_9ROSI